MYVKHKTIAGVTALLFCSFIVGVLSVTTGLGFGPAFWEKISSFLPLVPTGHSEGDEITRTCLGQCLGGGGSKKPERNWYCYRPRCENSDLKHWKESPDCGFICVRVTPNLSKVNQMLSKINNPG